MVHMDAHSMWSHDQDDFEYCTQLLTPEYIGDHIQAVIMKSGFTIVIVYMQLSYPKIANGLMSKQMPPPPPQACESHDHDLQWTDYAMV